MLGWTQVWRNLAWYILVQIILQWFHVGQNEYISPHNVSLFLYYSLKVNLTVKYRERQWHFIVVEARRKTLSDEWLDAKEEGESSWSIIHALYFPDVKTCTLYQNFLHYNTLCSGRGIFSLVFFFNSRCIILV